MFEIHYMDRLLELAIDGVMEADSAMVEMHVECKKCIELILCWQRFCGEVWMHIEWRWHGTGWRIGR